MSSNIAATPSRDEHRGAADRRQHVDRGRRALGPVRARREDLRLSQGPADGAEGRGLGAARWPGGGRCRPTKAPRFDRSVRVRRVARSRRASPGAPAPRMSSPITGVDARSRELRRSGQARGGAQVARLYGPRAGHARCRTSPVEHIFIGSCTNSRIEDLRAAAEVRARAQGQRRHPAGAGRARARAWSSARPRRRGSTASSSRPGFEWREPGCSMCLAMNPDKVPPGERCASTSNRNFVGRQGPGARTHLLSPAMAAAAAVTGPPRRRARAGRDERRHRRRGPRLSARPRQYRHRHHHPRRASEDGHRATGSAATPSRRSAPSPATSSTIPPLPARRS